MNREEAVHLLKEVHQACDGFGEQGIMLMPPDSNDLSHGYQVHIKATFADEHLECIKPLVRKHNLAMEYEPEKQLLVIYKPMK